MKDSHHNLLPYAATLGLFFILATLWATGNFSKTDPQIATQISGCTYRTVTHVVDGDTFDVENGARIRMIGIDAPELNTEFWGKQARMSLKYKIEGEKVCLKISSFNKVDKYHRLLRYVYHDNHFINANMVESGAARAYTFFPFEYKKQFLSLQSLAKSQNKGMWNEQAQEKYETRDENRNVLCGEAILCAEEAVEHVGERQTVRFYVAASYNSGKAVFLNSNSLYQSPRGFTAVIFVPIDPSFPDNPAAFYKNKTIEVSGKITLHEGRPEIVLERPDQIRIMR